MSVLQQGTLLGKLPGMKDWKMYTLELTPTTLHILDENGRKRLRSLEIDSSDMCGEDTKNKKEFRFYLLRSDGKYTFRCDRPHDKTTWITQLQTVIHTVTEDGEPLTPLTPPTRTIPKISALDTPLPPAPGGVASSPRASIISNDSGFGASEGGVVKGNRRGFRSAPASGDGRFNRATGNACKSDGIFGRPPVQVVADDTSEMNYEKCKWFWGTSSRQEAERRLLSEGKVGNFIVRINASGHFVMTYWRKDGIHHHKILNHGTIYRFEKSAVEAEGESLVDLLDTYMKANSAKKMEPFGGALYEMYNYAWTPPAFDMNLLEERLKEQKKIREEAKASQRPGQYTPIDIPGESSGSSVGSSREDSGSGSFNPPAPNKTARGKTLPSPPPKKPVKEDKMSMSTEEPKAGKAKPLPPTPKNKPGKQLEGAAFIQGLKKAVESKPTPKPKPKPANKMSKTDLQSPTHLAPPTHKAQPPVDIHEPPAYANCGFGQDKETPSVEQPPAEEESLYMNMQAPRPPPSRRPKPRGVPQEAPSEYQNIGTHAKGGKRRH